jgi:integrase
MSVKVRPYRSGGWEVDITFRLPDGRRFRERTRAAVRSRTAATRWGEKREQHLLLHGRPQPAKEVPTLEQFADRFVDGHARANQQKPSGIAAKESIMRVHLNPLLGSKRLDAITTEQVQRLKKHLTSRKPKTVNNVLTVLNTLLKKAVEWDVIDRIPCTIRLLPVPKSSAQFHDFAEFEHLVSAGQRLGASSCLIILLGGEAGLRCGEIAALEWRDVDLSKRQLCVQRSNWHGHITSTKGGRLRYVPMTARLADALRQARHLRGARVLCDGDGNAFTPKMVSDHVRRASKRAGLVNRGVHVLRHTFCSHLAMRGAPVRAIQELAGHQELGTTQRYMHLSPAALDAAIRLLERHDSAPRGDHDTGHRGDILETDEERSGNALR